MMRIKQANTEDSEEWLEPHLAPQAPVSVGSALALLCRSCRLSHPFPWAGSRMSRGDDASRAPGAPY